ncbi:hypothetical protein AB6A23_14670 [Paenibacillus tarimensis]
MMRKRTIIVLAVSILFIAISLNPMFLMIKEHWTGTQIMNRYEVDHAYIKDGYPRILDAREIEVEGMRIEILEKDTGKDAPETFWDKEEGVPGGAIVTVQIRINGVNIAEPTELWLSNRDRGSRYFSWLDVLTVKDRTIQENSIAIVQRLTDDEGRMEDRKWRIVSVKYDGTWKDEVLTYKERSENPLGVRMVTVSGTSMMAMGYHSDILQSYPTLFFPLIYPWITSVIGVMLLVIGAVMIGKDRFYTKI